MIHQIILLVSFYTSSLGDFWVCLPLFCNNILNSYIRETYEPLLLSVPKKIKAEISASVNKGNSYKKNYGLNPVGSRKNSYSGEHK